MTFLRVVGDVHGAIDTPAPKNKPNYRTIIKNAPYSIQLGDMGFNYSGLNDVDTNHRFIAGNHENYDDLPPSALSDYGLELLGPFEFFFVRGEWSIDINWRIKAMLGGGSKSWWQEEELSLSEMDECFSYYKEVQPDVVMTHGCPTDISELVGNPGVWKYFGWDQPRTTRTQLLLQDMWDYHAPKLWIFGHYHRNWTRTIGGTKFVCIDELDWLDFNPKWEIV